METAGAEETSEVRGKVFKMMNRWMKRRIERSRARCATEKFGSARLDTHQAGSHLLANCFPKVAEKQPSKLRLQAKVEQ